MVQQIGIALQEVAIVLEKLSYGVIIELRRCGNARRGSRAAIAFARR
jgi:hypothetical protein